MRRLAKAESSVDSSGETARLDANLSQTVVAQNTAGALRLSAVSRWMRSTAGFASCVSLLFLAIAALGIHSFPSLYGDEYGSMFELNHLAVNLHAIGYNLQLNAWTRLFSSDALLRVLSAIWAAVSLAVFYRWLAAEQVPQITRRIAILLLAINPFFWQYALQIRFYSYFLAMSLLVFWRCAEVRRAPSEPNIAWFAMALLLVVTSHFFGLMVVSMALIMLLGSYRPRWAIVPVVCGVIPILALFIWPSALHALVALVYRFTNPYSAVPYQAARGISPAMLAKIPLTFYVFAAGERLYPLMLWITTPIILIVAWCAFRGISQLRRHPALAGWAALSILVVVALYLILDPLAPPALQGAAPRYAIFVLPIFWAVLALGAAASKLLRLGLAATQVAAMAFFLFPIWSYGGSDLANWPAYLRETVVTPNQTCIVVDGRGRAPVERYAPTGVTIAGQLTPCIGYERILLISNDYRLPMIRSFDRMSLSLAHDYDLVTNIVQFPAQVTVYQRSADGLLHVPPARLDLPEQDLVLPIRTPTHGWMLQGFARLDATTPSLDLRVVAPGATYLLANYRDAARPIPQGTPSLSLRWYGPDGQTQETILHAGVELGAWDGACGTCMPAASWTKRLALVGGHSFPDAYRQYNATIWAQRLVLPPWPAERVTLTSLLDGGTIYVWGIYPEK
jgi:hypothetical protein